MTTRALALALFALCAAPQVVLAQGAPATVSFVARLQDQGLPLMGSHDFKLVMYDAPTGGNNVWQETRTGVAIGADGILYLDLGSVTPLTSTVFAGGGRYLEITIDQNAPASPRILLESVPYALRSTKASDADTLQGIAPTAFQKAVTSTCTGTQSIQSIASDGSVTCYTGQVYTAAGGGGLLLSTNMFSVDPTVYQKRIVGCASGAIASVAQDGTATCVAIPSYTAGSGISLASNQIAADTTIQRALTSSCSSGGILNTFSQGGASTCYGLAPSGGLSFSANNFSVDTTVIQPKISTSSGRVDTQETTGNGNTAYTDLTTTGPSTTVTVPASGKVMVTLTAQISANGGGAGAMSFDGCGLTAADTNALSATGTQQASATYLVTCSSTGSQTLTARYKNSGGGGTNSTFRYRHIIAIAVP